MDEQVQQGHIEVPIEFHIPEELTSRYATNLVVQHQRDEFIISFFEVFPPPLLGSPEEIRAKAAQITSVRAKCVARIIVASGRMPEFVQVLRDNLDRYLQSMKPEQSE